MTKNPHCTSFWLSWPIECNSVTDDVIIIMFCSCQYQWHHMTREVMLHLIFIVPDLRYELCHWQCHLASGDTCANSDTCPKSHISPCFNFLDLGNADVPLIMPSASWDADTGIIIWSQKSCWNTFYCLDLRNTMVSLMILLALCDAQANVATWPKEDMLHIIHFSLPKEINGAVGIMWHYIDFNGIMWHQNQWHHMMPLNDMQHVSFGHVATLAWASHNANSIINDTIVFLRSRQ